MQYVLAFLLLILLGCTDSFQSHKGGIWDEAENSVRISATTNKGQPIIGASVYLYTQQKWTESAKKGIPLPNDSAITDSNGQAQLKTSSWPAYLLIESTEGAQSTLIDSTDSVQLITPKPVSFIQGDLKSFDNQDLPEKIFLLGTPYMATVLANGQFEFSSVSSGNYTLVALFSHSIQPIATINTTPGDTLFLSTIELPDLNSTLIEDFEDFDNQHRFGSLLGTGWWFTYSDTSNMVYPSIIADGIEKNADSWNNENSLHIIFGNQYSENTWYGLCGFNIDRSLLESDSSKSFHDFTPMQSISFMAKGHGTIQVQLNGPHPLRAVYTHSLDSSWENVLIPMTEFQYEGSQEFIISHISNISFLALEKTELWLDNIQFNNLSPQQLFQKLAMTP